MSITRENQIIERLKRKYQEYFQAYFSNGLRNPSDLYDILFKVDFNLDNGKGELVADISFSYFHWKLAEMIKADKDNRFNIKKYHPDEIKILALNIFPWGETILHYAYTNLNIVRRFYKVIQQEILREQEMAGDEKEVVGFEIPFMKNFNGETPLHLCLQSKNYKSANIIL